MTSLYKQSVPPLIKSLRALSGLLEKGAKFAQEKGKTEEEMLSYRLIEDMLPLSYQVQSCSNTAKFLAVRVGGIEPIVLEDNEKTFPELQARITKTIEILESVDPKAMDGKEDAEVLMKTPRMGTFKFTGYTYVSEYTLPNFHFHMTSAYCILRQLGAPVGAMDYLKDVFTKVEE
ncbi:hypothetical protein GQ53DRAFT_16237 [Thozetella sp. PMI_491]|nr:hypothetical protein GQ53DRAFT_16237 [Thozetella sp. PMI_491]